jgi:hypothetical protein
MSETQALEPEAIEPIEDVQEIVQETEEVEEVEIVVSGEDEPPSKPVNPFSKRINKLNGKIEAKSQEAQEAIDRAEAAEAQLKLYQIKEQSQAPAKRPKLEEYDSDDDYYLALDEYETGKIEEATRKTAEQILNQNQNQTTQSQRQAVYEDSANKHYERAGALKVSDYEATEDKAIEILGGDAVKQIMANTDNSEVVLYHLGKNPGKAEAIANLIKSNPMKGVIEIGGLAAKLQIRPKTKPAPDPEDKVASGAAALHKRGPKGAKFW